MNSKGQILARQLIIIMSWAVLLFTVILMFVFQSFAKDEAYTPLTSVHGSAAESVLAAYLRQTVDMGGDKVPFAELLAFEVMNDNQVIIKQQMEAFLAQIPSQSPRQLRVVLPARGGPALFPLEVGSEVTAKDKKTATAQLPLPDGSNMLIVYTEASS
ncbi:hypothetical protein HY493_02175 [Candidatus Woesearchaeota archaeon]|nr:hypothetical protein [Candidatus Woesearchaeota archaeon]